MHLTPEDKDVGTRNFQTAVGREGLTRRDFMKGLAVAGTILPISAAVYFGYRKLDGKAVRAGLIGAGDQGGVLVGEHNPEFLQFIGYCDPRPTNQERIFRGESGGPRKGFERVYGNSARKDIRRHTTYQDLLADKNVEAVVIALPLHLHAQVAIDAMRAGKHVFCEKLMAWDVEQCKTMIRVAEEADRILAIGHQRHYSLLYAQAIDIVKGGTLGAIKHIRATWHRNNALPRRDAEGREERDAKTGDTLYRDSWRPDIAQLDRDALENQVAKLGYKSVEELVRWRLYARTSGGLMAELGSHQLDACGLFLGKARPLAVSATGGKLFYRDDREVDDHLFATFEFPGPKYFADERCSAVQDKDDRVVVTFSSITTNALEPYGECVMGTQGTMFVEEEQRVMLFPERGVTGKPAMSMRVVTPGNKPIVESSATVDREHQERGQASLAEPTSKGYREELEHFAYCVRHWNEPKKDRPTPRCDGRTALVDAVVALTANQALRKRERIEFRNDWFDPAG